MQLMAGNSVHVLAIKNHVVIAPDDNDGVRPRHRARSPGGRITPKTTATTVRVFLDSDPVKQVMSQTAVTIR